MKDYLKYFKSIGFRSCVLLLVNFIFFRLKYLTVDGRSGYFLVKRKWVWWIAMPLLLPIYVLVLCVIGIIDYVKHIFNFTMRWIDDNDKDLSLRKQILYRRNLWY